MKTIIAAAVSGIVLLGACQTTQPRTPNRFEKADVDRNKLLSREEVGTYVAAKVFEGVDKDNDNRLTRDEWVTGGNDMTAQHFRKADANRDSVVTERELTKAAIHSQRLNAFMTGADSNRDGFVSKPEALGYYARREGPLN